MSATAQRRDAPVELAQSLVSYLDASGGNISTMYDALESLRTHGPKGADDPFDLDAFEHHLNEADDALDTAWDLLEEDAGEPPLMSPEYIDWTEADPDNPKFIPGSGADRMLSRIESELQTARDELGDAWGIIEEGEDVSSDWLKGDYGLYETLGDFIDYVHQELRKMCRMASKATGGM